MRTTIRLNDQLLFAVKQYAQATGRTLTAVIEDALHEKLNRRSDQTSRRDTVQLTTVGGKGLQKGVDLDDTSALLDLMGE